MFIIISQQTLEAHENLKKMFSRYEFKISNNIPTPPWKQTKNPGATGKKNHSFFQLFGPLKK